MKLFYALATAALLATSAVHADTSSNGLAAKIAESYAAAGYSNIVVQHIDGNWIVTADFNGVTQSFLVDKHTGASTPVDLTLISGKGRHGGSDGKHASDTSNGGVQEVGDDNGVDANDDVGDDNGVDANDDVGDDNGVDASDDQGDDNGSDSSDDNSGSGGGDKGGKGKD